MEQGPKTIPGEVVASETFVYPSDAPKGAIGSSSESLEAQDPIYHVTDLFEPTGDSIPAEFVHTAEIEKAEQPEEVPEEEPQAPEPEQDREESKWSYRTKKTYKKPYYAEHIYDDKDRLKEVFSKVGRVSTGQQVKFLQDLLAIHEGSFQFTPTEFERDDRFSDDLVVNANLAPNDPHALSSDQLSGVAQRLYKSVEALGGQEALGFLNNSIVNKDSVGADISNLGNEPAWITAAQRYLYNKLGGLPSEVRYKPESKAELDKIPYFYFYSALTSKPDPWNRSATHNTQYGMEQARKLRDNYRASQMRQRFALAA